MNIVVLEDRYKLLIVKNVFILIYCKYFMILRINNGVIVVFGSLSNWWISGWIRVICIFNGIWCDLVIVFELK